MQHNKLGKQMNVKHLKIDGLYGYLNKDVKFNRNLNLLVGINGSGKTSILNVINWLVRPSIPNLCVTVFDRFVLDFTLGEATYKITCTNNEKEMQLLVQGPGRKKLSPLIVRLKAPPSSIANDADVRSELLNEYAALVPEKKEINIWRFMTHDLPKPVVLGLDRNLYTEEEDKLYSEKKLPRRFYEKRSASLTPADRAADILNTEYRKRRNELMEYSSKLKDRIMLLSFERLYKSGDIFRKPKLSSMTKEEVEKLEKKVLNYITQYVEVDKRIVGRKVTSYFEDFRRLIDQSGKHRKKREIQILLKLNAIHFRKIQSLIKVFNNFERKSQRAMCELDDYLNVANSFFQDSAKRIEFKSDTAEIKLHLLDKRGKIIQEYVDVKNLSSGEKQILILFTHLKFNSLDGKIFIVDEPEMSLHPKWQEDFLDAVENLTPRGVQLIMATHSPVLAGKRKASCTVLLPY